MSFSHISYRPLSDNCAIFLQNYLKTQWDQRYPLYGLLLPLSYRTFLDNCMKWPQNDFTAKMSKVLHIYHNYLLAPNFTPVQSTASSFPVTGHFETSTLNDTHRAKNYPWVTNFTVFHSTASHYHITHNFETTALNDLKITLNTRT